MLAIANCGLKGCSLHVRRVQVLNFVSAGSFLCLFHLAAAVTAISRGHDEAENVGSALVRPLYRNTRRLRHRGYVV